MIKLIDAATRMPLVTLTEEQLQQLIDALEEEREEAQDYYINQATIGMLEERGADAGLVDLLRKALGDREDMDVRWEPV